MNKPTPSHSARTADDHRSTAGADVPTADLTPPAVRPLNPCETNGIEPGSNVEVMRRLVDILDNTADFVGTADINLNARYINRSGRRMVGLNEQEDASTRRMGDFCPEWARRVILDEGIPTARRTGFWNGETALLAPDGREIPVSHLIIVHKSPDGSVAYYSTIARDISDRKCAEQERADLVANLGERVKELTALHELCRLLQRPDQNITQLLQQTADLLPPAMQFPQLTVARVTWGAEQCTTPEFDVFPMRTCASFTTADGTTGTIEVAYRESPEPGNPNADFLDEETDLLNSVAEILRQGIDRLHAEMRLRHRANHDSLTGLSSRSFFVERLEQVIRDGRDQPNQRFALLALDIDRFKVVNDGLGHLRGDELLCAIADRLRQQIGEHPEFGTLTLARLGGDEFTVLMEDVPDWSAVDRCVEVIRSCFSRPFSIHGRELFTSASIGIACSHEPGPPEDAQAFLRDADTALRHVKMTGKGRVDRFDRSMHEQMLDQLELENDLRRALQAGQFQLHYQPIVSLEDRALVGFEALMRWRHPQRGMISPARFIPLAEELGLITSLGNWAIERACRQLAQWQQQFTAPRLSVAVNVASQQLTDGTIVQRLDRAMQATQLWPGTLKLELTENSLIDSSKATRDTLHELHSRRVPLCLDDFGTGYSALSYLHRLPLSTIKIDRSFVGQVGADRMNANLLRGILDLAKGIHLDVIAEGIETETQLDLLRGMGCETGQGYLFSKPLPAAEIPALLKTAYPARRRLNAALR